MRRIPVVFDTKHPDFLCLSSILGIMSSNVAVAVATIVGHLSQAQHGQVPNV